jgi:predicted  nucleic acid-binding Zn-ribbon protein
MGNIMIWKKKNTDRNYSMEDQRRLLLFENIEEKMEKLEQSVTDKYTNLVQTYNKEIYNLRSQVHELQKETDNTKSKIRNLQVLLDDKNQKISGLETKLINLESQDEFLSTINSQVAREEVFTD